MAVCEVLRCSNPATDRFTSGDGRVEARVCAGHRTALEAGGRWDRRSGDGSILMGVDLAPVLADCVVAAGSGNGVTVTLERVDDDRPFSVWLSREEAAKLGELLIRQSGLVGEARSGLAQAKGRRQAT